MGLSRWQAEWALCWVGELGGNVGGRIRPRTTCLHEEGWECVGSGGGTGEIPSRAELLNHRKDFMTHLEMSVA